MLNVALKIACIISLLLSSIGFTLGIYYGYRKYATLVDATVKTEGSLSETLAGAGKVVAMLPKKVDDLNNIFDRQLSATNASVSSLTGSLTSDASELTKQTAGVENVLSQSVFDIDNQFNHDLRSIDGVVNNPDIPKLVRDARQLTAISGLAMGHIEGMANTIDKSTPSLVRSSVSVANSSAEVSASVAQIAKRVSTPQTKWQKFRAVLGLTLELGAKIY